jgi:hypothetical protein
MHGVVFPFSHLLLGACMLNVAGTMLDRHTFCTTQILLSKCLAWHMTQITALPPNDSAKRASVMHSDVL